MAQLLVRNLDDDVKRRLQERAAREGRSMEEAVREILRAAALEINAPAPDLLGKRIARRFAGLGLSDKAWELRGQAARTADLDR